MRGVVPQTFRDLHAFHSAVIVCDHYPLLTVQRTGITAVLIAQCEIAHAHVHESISHIVRPAQLRHDRHDYHGCFSGAAARTSLRSRHLDRSSGFPVACRRPDDVLMHRRA